MAWEKNITEKQDRWLTWITWKKELQRRKESSEVEIHLESRKYNFGIHQAIVCIDSGSKHSHPSVRDSTYQGKSRMTEWMTRGGKKTTLIQKDQQKGTIFRYYRPIMGLLMMLKIPISQLRREMYYLYALHLLERTKRVPEWNKTL